MFISLEGRRWDMREKKKWEDGSEADLDPNSLHP
jgi:hypothetical protein